MMFRVCGGQCVFCKSKCARFRPIFEHQNSKVANFLRRTPALATAYDPKEVENESHKKSYFDLPSKSSKCFTMILPPPNITGTLHLGHALTTTIQDVIIRWHKMNGVSTVWVPGIDHAGIATQMVVEKRLWKEKKLTRHDLGRDAFVEEVWKWKHDKATVIRQQLVRLGASLDWPRETFTMDPVRSRAVTEAFIKLYDAGLIYRSDYLVNWSCVLQSAISDIEVEHRQVNGQTPISVPGYEQPVMFGQLTTFAYKLCDSDEEIAVATTRPETMLGDTAVAVNTRDDRYSKFIGHRLWHPFRKETIPIICDDFVDPNFGTGAVKVTPAHDHIDFEVGKRHALKVVQVIDERGKLRADFGGELSGVRRFDARDIILRKLEGLGLLRGRHDHQMIVPICSRSEDVVEFMIKPQWFVECQEMARRAIEDVKTGRLTIDPDGFEKIWFNWLENIRDWCISRQLWWGHRIPAYMCQLKGQEDRKCWVAADSEQVALSKSASLLCVAPQEEHNIVVVQDEDVLDTWFSSALQPFSVFGWPQQTEDLIKHYPLSLMETGHDILFFWVARMVMLGTQLTGRLPFSRIVLNGIVCDESGRKMSKSLGNVIAPENVIAGNTLKELEDVLRANRACGVLSEDELKRAIRGQRKTFPEGIPECGVDALRFTFCSHNVKNHFINFDVNECHTNRLFCNKMWQATKFAKNAIEKVGEGAEGRLDLVDTNGLSKMDRWILSRLAFMVSSVNESVPKCEFHVATTALKNFLYYNFCDVYLETTKRNLRSIDSQEAANHSWTLALCLDVGLRFLYPFMPGLSQHLHERLPFHPFASPQDFDFAQVARWRDEKIEEDVEAVLEVVVAIRRMKKIFNITGKHKSDVFIVSKEIVYDDFQATIEDLTRCNKIVLKRELQTQPANSISDAVGLKTIVYLTVPEGLQEALELDATKLDAKKAKLAAELQKMQKMVSAENYRIKAMPESQKVHAKKMISLEEKITRIDLLKKFCKN